jgi:hypothetical protein
VSRPNTDPTGDRTAYTIADAADRLGITSEAVRMRLKRATLAGEKRDGHWVVYLDASTEWSPTDDHTAPEQATQRPTERDPTIDPTPLVAVYETLVASQREEIAFLRRELETRTDELQRRDVLLREALGRIPQLGAGEHRDRADDGVSQPSNDEGARLGANGDARLAAPAGQGGAIAPEQGPEPSTGSAPQKPARRAWWRFWER